MQKVVANMRKSGLINEVFCYWVNYLSCCKVVICIILIIRQNIHKGNIVTI